PRPPLSPLFPYTTLFRSVEEPRRLPGRAARAAPVELAVPAFGDQLVAVLAQISLGEDGEAREILGRVDVLRAHPVLGEAAPVPGHVLLGEAQSLLHLSPVELAELALRPPLGALELIQVGQCRPPSEPCFIEREENVTKERSVHGQGILSKGWEL